MDPAAYSVRTPEGEVGPLFSEAEVRVTVRAYRDERGEEAVLGDVVVHRVPERFGAGEHVDVRDFL